MSHKKSQAAFDFYNLMLLFKVATATAGVCAVIIKNLLKRKGHQCGLQEHTKNW